MTRDEFRIHLRCLGVPSYRAWQMAGRALDAGVREYTTAVDAVYGFAAWQDLPEGFSYWVSVLEEMVVLANKRVVDRRAVTA